MTMRYSLILLGGLSACTKSGDDTNGDGTNPATPTVASTTPVDGATGVPINASVTSVFSEAMDPATLTAVTFTLTSGVSAPMDGTVIYADGSVSFWPAVHLAADTEFTATITTAAKSALGAPLAEDYDWSFTTGTTLAPGMPVSLGSAGDFAILAKSGVSTVPDSTVTGDVGVSPVAASFLTGFSLSADATNVFATSTQVEGKLYAADYAPPTPDIMTAAVGDMELAFTDAAGRAPDVTGLGAGAIGGMTLAPGVYKWSTGLLVSTDVTLAGSATDIWIFQVAQDLTFASDARVVLSGGALPEHVFWQVSGLVDLGSTAHCEGVVLTQTAATLRTGASINGRLLAQMAVTLDQNVVVEPNH